MAGTQQHENPLWVHFVTSSRFLSRLSTGLLSLVFPLWRKSMNPCGLLNVSSVPTSHSAPFSCHADGVLFWTRVLGAAVWFEKGLVRGESRFNGPQLVDVCALVSEEFVDSSPSVNISTVRLTWFWILLPRPDWITLFFGACAAAAAAAAAAATLQPLLKPLVVSFRFEPSHMDAVIIRAFLKLTLTSN